MNTTKNLTENQARVLAIIEAGGANGVAVDSIVREERTEGRLTADIMRTIHSLADRGAITAKTERPQVIASDGKRVATREIKIAKVAQQ